MVLIRLIVGEEVLLDWQSGLRLVLVVHSIDLRQQPVLWLVDNLEACSKARACHQALAQGYCQQEVGIIVAVVRSSDRVAHVRGLATRFLGARAARWVSTYASALRACKKERARRGSELARQCIKSRHPSAAFFVLLRASSLIKGDAGPQTLRQGGGRRPGCCASGQPTRGRAGGSQFYYMPFTTCP